MKVETEIKNWGNSLALPVTGVMAELLGFKEGVAYVSEDGLMAKPVSNSRIKIELPYSEKELLEGLTPWKAHNEPA